MTGMNCAVPWIHSIDADADYCGLDGPPWFGVDVVSRPDDWTIRRLLQWTTDYLTRCGSETPRLDGEILLAAACGCERIELYTAYDETTQEDVRAAFRSLVRERSRGVPVAYLVGKREFYSLSFRVTPDVLIPRPETEHVVLSVLERVNEWNSPEPLRFIDIGTGSGVIAICLARYGPNCHVLGVDISSAALEVARDNVVAHGVEERVELLQSDLFCDVPDETTFDVVVSNPPYVSEAEMAEVPVEVRDHEPHVALVGGPRGSEVIERLVPQAAEYLRPGGWLIFEISPMLEDSARQIVNADARLGPPEVSKDLAGHARVVQVSRR